MDGKFLYSIEKDPARREREKMIEDAALVVYNGPLSYRSDIMPGSLEWFREHLQSALAIIEPAIRADEREKTISQISRGKETTSPLSYPAIRGRGAAHD